MTRLARLACNDWLCASMRDTLIPPELAKQLVGGDDAMVGTGRIIHCNHGNKALVGGIVREQLGDASNQDWVMTVGTMIIIPCRTFRWANGQCGWAFEDILTQGMDQERRLRKLF